MNQYELSSVTKAYEPAVFQTLGHQLIDKMTAYLTQVQERQGPVLTPEPPNELLAQLDVPFPLDGLGLSAAMPLWEKILAQSNHLHHPRYIGHQISGAMPIAALSDLLASLLNNSSVIFEMGPLNVAMERKVTEWMTRVIGWDAEAGGILTSGGSIANLTALLAARQVKVLQKFGMNAWKDGHPVHPPLAVMVSEQAHYSVKRAVQIMGWGEEGCILVPVDKDYCLNPDALEPLYQEALSKGRQVIAVVGSACSTATGSFDPLEKLADFCEAHDLWFHVDGAHGASVLLSEKYRHLLQGIGRADSVIWDPHKMMMMPALLSAVLFKNKQHSYATFSQEATYLFQGEVEDEWFNFGHRTLECTKRMMGLKLYIPLMVYGTQFFADHITHTHDMARTFARMLAQHSNFEMPLQPQSNILCFRYRPDRELSREALDQLQCGIRERILKSGSFYVVQTRLASGIYLRCSVMNPLTTVKDLEDLINTLIHTGQQLAGETFRETEPVLS